MGGRRVAAAMQEATARGSSTPRFEPEYLRSLDEVLVVYDQVAADHLFREVREILSCLPPGGTVHLLCSKRKETEARKRLQEVSLRTNLLACDCDQLWGDWGRDIFHVGWREDRTALLVPYTKTALTRGDLTRGYEVLRSLSAPDRDVKLVPLSFEGGNLAYDRVGRERVLFVGNSVILDSAELYRRWFERALEPREVVELLLRSFGVDRVVLLGRTKDGAPLRQASFFFHIDLASAIVAEGTAVVERFEVPASDTELRQEVEEEVALYASDVRERRRTEELLARKAIRVKLPEGPAEIRSSVEAALRLELDRLREAEAELDAVRGTFKGLGYRVRDLPTDWRHVRRTQSYANVLVASDRLIFPIFPPSGAGKARVVLLPEGRQIVEVLRHPEPHEYAMDGWNLENYRVYRSLLENIRVVKDSFYLAGGNVHCVVGAIG